eukprot:TRINITY_DN7663_c0_g1_i3.p1 TRINITY_DN7663_c0_g1~~TRINITY_DN7663_c0_g1_i3.p1  ORF type:complete len:607 (-),score=76.47 TRINITY_DN7663_c0_g1_i3:46-1614(-)
MVRGCEVTSLASAARTTTGASPVEDGDGADPVVSPKTHLRESLMKRIHAVQQQISQLQHQRHRSTQQAVTEEVVSRRATSSSFSPPPRGEYAHRLQHPRGEASAKRNSSLEQHAAAVEARVQVRRLLRQGSGKASEGTRRVPATAHLRTSSKTSNGHTAMVSAGSQADAACRIQRFWRRRRLQQKAASRARRRGNVHVPSLLAERRESGGRSASGAPSASYQRVPSPPAPLPASLPASLLAPAVPSAPSVPLAPSASEAARARLLRQPVGWRKGRLTVVHYAASRIQRAWRISHWHRCFVDFSRHQVGWLGSLSWLRRHSLLYGNELADNEDVRWWIKSREDAPLDREVDPWGFERLQEHLCRTWFGGSNRESSRHAEREERSRRDPKSAHASQGCAVSSSSVPPARRQTGQRMMQANTARAAMSSARVATHSPTHANRAPRGSASSNAGGLHHSHSPNARASHVRAGAPPPRLTSSSSGLQRQPSRGGPVTSRTSAERSPSQRLLGRSGSGTAMPLAGRRR